LKRDLLEERRQSMESVQSLEKVHTPGTVQTAGVLCAVGGAGWLVDGVVSSAVIQSGGATFVVWEVSWILVQSLLLIGVAGLAFSGAAPGWFGGISLGLALLGRVDFVAAEIHSLIIGYDSDLLPLGALVTAVGMTLVGIAVLRAKRWGGWQRFAPLLAGVYPSWRCSPSYLSRANRTSWRSRVGDCCGFFSATPSGRAPASEGG
jgi:hypothetical protein